MNEPTRPATEEAPASAVGPGISVMPTHWRDLRYMSDVDPLGEADLPCLLEIRSVLERHGRLDRLGVTLLHRHFELADDEIMVEEIDFEQRRLVVRPQRREDIGPCVETSWQLDGESLQSCAKQHCYSTCIEQEKAFRELMRGAAGGG